jgi:hypothetical protein
MQETIKSSGMEDIYLEDNKDKNTYNLFQMEYGWNDEDTAMQNIKMNLQQIEQLNQLTTQILLRENAKK